MNKIIIDFQVVVYIGVFYIEIVWIFISYRYMYLTVIPALFSTEMRVLKFTNSKILCTLTINNKHVFNDTRATYVATVYFKLARILLQLSLHIFSTNTIHCWLYSHVLHAKFIAEKLLLMVMSL